jgi:hypothetical protein|uniref:Uncharacterized protein n=1 Tax=Myoviridae sp. ctCpP1 TaxID=2825054 RepID=A0A8S5V7W8_9CAUD|nr:MAG TPA: hypothetical protein [Myoviridae sp. ctCpP1]
MIDNTNPRDIRHEMTDIIALLGDEYTVTNVECDPGDTAIKITRQNNGKTMYVIAYSNPDDTEIQLYDEDDSLTVYNIFRDGSLNDSTPEGIADYIIRKF